MYNCTVEYMCFCVIVLIRNGPLFGICGDEILTADVEHELWQYTKK